VSVNNRAGRGFSFSPHVKFADGDLVGGMGPRIMPALALPIG
jgi:hypothetical protein